MLDEAKTQKERSDDLALLSGLTRRQLKELEEKEKTPAQKTAEAIILLLPLLCGGIALLEYLLVPNNSRNRNPWSYVWVLGAALGVPVLPFSHQQGHIAASLWGSGHMELMDEPHLAWHLSGGTTELLLVEPDGKNVKAERLGGTSDISAGQLIDRTGKLLGLPFPAGKSIDALSRGSDCRDRYRVKLHGLEFSFSGIQNKAEAFYAATNSPADTARFVMNCIVTCIADATRAALAEKPGLPVVFSGGVASNSMLRERMREFSPVFAEPQYSTDNAMGIAVLTALQEGL